MPRTAKQLTALETWALRGDGTQESHRLNKELSEVSASKTYSRHAAMNNHGTVACPPEQWTSSCTPERGPEAASWSEPNGMVGPHSREIATGCSFAIYSLSCSDLLVSLAKARKAGNSLRVLSFFLSFLWSGPRSDHQSPNQPLSPSRGLMTCFNPRLEA